MWGLWAPCCWDALWPGSQETQREFVGTIPKTWPEMLWVPPHRLSWDGYSAEGCTQVLCAAHLLLTPSAVLRTSSLSLRNLLSFWNWPYPSQVSSLPLFPVVLHNKGEECGFLPHLLSLLFSYNTFFCWKYKCNLLPGFITTLHELEDLHARLHT